MRNQIFEALSTAKCRMHKSIKLNYFEHINILESCNQPGIYNKSSNFIPELVSCLEIGKCGAACLLELKSCVVLMRIFGLVCWQLVHDMHATEIFGIQPSCKLSLFFMKMSELVWYFYYL